MVRILLHMKGRRSTKFKIIDTVNSKAIRDRKKENQRKWCHSHKALINFHTFITSVPILQLVWWVIGNTADQELLTWRSQPLPRVPSVWQQCLWMTLNFWCSWRTRASFPICHFSVWELAINAVLCGSPGGSSSPPSKITHCTQYVFLIWEKTCTISPTALMVTIRSMSLVVPPMLFGCKPFRQGEGGWTSKLAGNLSTISEALSDVAAAPEILGTVGNLCSPARRPEHRSVYS